MFKSSINVQVIQTVHRWILAFRQIDSRGQVQTLNTLSSQVERFILGGGEVVDDAGNGRMETSATKFFTYQGYLYTRGCANKHFCSAFPAAVYDVIGKPQKFLCSGYYITLKNHNF